MKKRMVQQACALALSGAMLLGLAACGNSGTDAPAQTPDNTAGDTASQDAAATTPEAPADTTASGDVDELYWFSDVAGWGPATANWSVDESPATRYIKENIGLTLKIEQPPTDASTKLGLMLASDDLPDLMSITNSDMYRELVAADKVWDMQTFLETYDPDSHLLKDFPADIRQALVDVYGDWYSYPSHMESKNNREVFPPDDEIWVNVVEKGSNGCIMFNTEIMDALGITPEDRKSVV